MRTVVYQSYRTNDVPAWIASCMQTVRQWAAANAFDYQFIDDQLFNRVPGWFRKKAGNQICPVADLARLVVAKEFLGAGYHRSIWVDADILVFAPERLNIDIENDFAFCREIWLESTAQGEVLCSQRVNNSISIFTRNTLYLDFLIDACQRIARIAPQLGKLDLGTILLTRLASAFPILLLNNVGMFSPPILADIVGGTDRYLRAYAQHLLTPLACANLCASLSAAGVSGVRTDDRFFEAAAAQCLRTKGEHINRFVGCRGLQL